MRHLLLSLHILFAIFAVGPLVHAATTAARGVKTGDAPAVASSARTARIYGYASLAVAVLGFGLVQPKWHAKFSYPWVWISIAIYLGALALTVLALVPSLEKAGSLIEQGEPAEALTGRVAAIGGIIALGFTAIVFLMVFHPGS